MSRQEALLLLSETGLLLLCCCQHAQLAMCEGKDVYCKDVYHAVCVDVPQILAAPEYEARSVFYASRGSGKKDATVLAATVRLESDPLGSRGLGAMTEI